MSAIAKMLELHMRAEKVTGFVPEHRFLADRKFRFDYAWPLLKFAVEVDGEVHRIAERFHADIEKHALAVLDGWTVLRVGGREIRAGIAIQWVKQALAMKQAAPC